MLTSAEFFHFTGFIGSSSVLFTKEINGFKLNRLDQVSFNRSFLIKDLFFTFPDRFKNIVHNFLRFFPMLNPAVAYSK